MMTSNSDARSNILRVVRRIAEPMLAHSHGVRGTWELEEFQSRNVTRGKGDTRAKRGNFINVNWTGWLRGGDRDMTLEQRIENTEATSRTMGADELQLGVSILKELGMGNPESAPQVLRIFTVEKRMTDKAVLKPIV